MSNELLTIDHVDLQFLFEPKKRITCTLYLTNKTSNYVAFKVKTTNPAQYFVRPNAGVVLPRSSAKVSVTMQALKEAPVNMQCKDKFLFQFVVARQGATTEEFRKEVGHRVEETKLKVIYVAPPQPPSSGSRRIRRGLEDLGNQYHIKMSNKLLTIDLVDLQFPFEPKKQINCSLYLTNKTSNYVAFKAKTTNPKQYCVRSNAGVVLPRSSVKVSVTMQALKEAPVNMQCEDKFLFQCVVARPGATTEEFRKEAGHRVEETKLKVIYVAPPQPPSSGSRRIRRGLGVLFNQYHIRMSNELLTIDPVDLQFPFKPKKQITCSLYLTNKTSNYVAFKAKTTNPKQYCVKPNAGVILPRSSVKVSITMQALKEAPVNMQCEDKFLFQCVVARPGATAEKVTSEMFRKEAEHRVEETKLKVIYVAPPQPPSSGSRRIRRGLFSRSFCLK